MNALKKRLGEILAGGYAFVFALCLYASLQTENTKEQGHKFFFVCILLTMPWSMGIVLIGFGLIHRMSNGMEYGLIPRAMINAILLYVAGNSFSKKYKLNKVESFG